MKSLKLLLCFALWVVSGGDVTAAEQRANTIEGAYLLVENDGYQRILSFDRSGNVSQVSDQQPLIGFTSGQGTWR